MPVSVVSYSRRRGISHEGVGWVGVALVAKVGPKRVNLIHMHARVSSQLQQEEGHQS